MEADLASRWDDTYAARGESGVSWFEENPGRSLELIEGAVGSAAPSVIDVGGGASRLVDAGLRAGWSMSVLDLSETALATARSRLGARAEAVGWIVADVRTWQPRRTYDIWHDRAAFHFLTEADDRCAYIERLRAAVKPGGHAVIATFASDGPVRCSGLPVMRYDPPQLAETIGKPFRLVAQRHDTHTTPWGSTQAFQFSVAARRRLGDSANRRVGQGPS